MVLLNRAASSSRWRTRWRVVGEAPAQLLDQVDRAVLAAGAADGHGEVAALVVAEAPAASVRRKVSIWSQHLATSGWPPGTGHRRVAPGQRPQFAHVVGVGQHAHVEHVVGVQRHAVLEGEALEHQRQPVGARTPPGRAPMAAQLRRAQLAGVDDGGDLAQVGQQLALELDGLDQRMRAPRAARPVRPTAGAGGASRRSAAPARRCWRRGTAGARHAFGAQLVDQRQQVRQRPGGAHVHRDGHRRV
jgi:hypothetical protein